MATEWKCYKQTFKDTWIRSLKSTVNLLVTDTVTPGLHLRFYANTKNIVFYLGYMVKGTRQHRNIKIGNWGDLKTETVREQAAEFRKQVTNGFDPMEERQKEIKKTLAEQRQRVKTSVLMEEYFEKVSKTRKRASTQKSDRGQIDRYLNPMLGNLWITDLELPIIIDFYDKMVAKTSFSTATRALQLVSAFWNWCELKGYKSMNSNPCSKVDKRRNEKKKHKRLTIEEYKRLLDAMDAGLTESPYNPRMFRALIRSIKGIINRFAPSSENNTNSYIQAIAKSTGFDESAQLDLEDDEVVVALMRAIIRHENGQQPYSDEDLRMGLKC